MKKNDHIKLFISLAITFFAGASILNNKASAMSFLVSPMNQRIVLMPGDTYRGSLTVSNPANNTENFQYIASPQPFSVIDNEMNVSLESNGSYSQILNWISIDETNGVIAPNNKQEIHFTINVPNNAPAGGQYVAIVIKDDGNQQVGNGLNITQRVQMAHLIYVDIAGDTIHDGSISDVNIPGFLFSGNITASSTMINNGNTHGDAKTILQVFPIFSDEEVYTNEEDPKTNIVLPETSRLVSIEWNDTPSAGIFNVIYTAEFEGVTTEVKKMVIVCPIWLLAIIIFAIISIIIYLVAKSRNRKKSGR